MHVKSLKVFCDVVDRRSFSRAADDNGISQSGASQMVHQLEEHLGVRLIDRSKRPFVLTAEGEVYYSGCRKIVQRVSALEEEVRALHQQVEGKVRVASIYSVGLTHMNQFVRDFVARHPKADVSLDYQHPRRVYDLVESDQADIGLVSYPKSSRTIQTTPWREERMVLVCGPDHQLAECAVVEPFRLDGLEMIGFDNDLHIRGEIDRTLSAMGVSVHVALQFDNIEMLKRAVEISGFSILPEPTIQREVAAGTLVQVACDGLEMIRPVGIIQRRGAELGRTARRFLELLQQQPSTDGHEGTRNGHALVREVRMANPK